MTSNDIAIAIGVCSALSDSKYVHDADEQSIEWNQLRAVVFYLQAALEESAKSEVIALGDGLGRLLLAE